jgi:hypothetical protein
MTSKTAILAPAYLRANVYSRKRMNDPEYVQEPQNHADHHHGVQDGLDRSSHRYEVIDQPKQYAYHDQNHQDLK